VAVDHPCHAESLEPGAQSRYDGSVLNRPVLVLLAGTIALVAAVAAATQPPSARPAAPLTVISAEGQRPLPASQVGDQLMVALDDLAALLELTVREDALSGGAAVGYKGRTVLLTAGQALASVSGRLVALPSPPVREGRRWLVPVEFVSRALAGIYDARLDVRKNSHLLLVGDVRVPRVAVREEPVGGQVRVTMEVAPKTPHTITQEGNRLLVRFEADALDVSIPAFAAQGLLQGIRVTDPRGTIALDLGPKFGSYRASLVPHDLSAELTIDLVPTAETPFPVTRAPAAPPPSGPPLPVPMLPPALRTVILDPGHGGDENGAMGAAGTLEKDITLAIARRLKAGLESRLGVRVLLTREADETVPLDDRAALANNNKGDLLISIHANASLRPEVAGAQIYYLSADEAGEEARRAAAARQSVPALGGGTRDVEMILWEVAQVRHLSESAELAGIVEEQMRAAIHLNPRPVQQAPFRVLAGANMPAVLVEVGFLTNAGEEERLKSDAHQEAIARALLDAVTRFRDSRGLAPRAPLAPAVPR